MVGCFSNSKAAAKNYIFYFSSSSARKKCIDKKNGNLGAMLFMGRPAAHALTQPCTGGALPFRNEVLEMVLHAILMVFNFAFGVLLPTLRLKNRSSKLFASKFITLEFCITLNLAINRGWF